MSKGKRQFIAIATGCWVSGFFSAWVISDRTAVDHIVYLVLGAVFIIGLLVVAYRGAR